MENIKAAAAKLEELAAQAGEIAATLAVLENSLLFASEREDRDMTEPCSVAVHVIECMATRLQLDVMQIGIELEAMSA